MIVLDTNVLSELMRPEPSPRVIGWLDSQPPASIWTASLCIFEVRMGLRLMARGRRREGLESRFDRVIREDLEDRVLDFDARAAALAADIAGRNQPRGVTIDLRDLLIAGTIAARKGTLATRNTRHFLETGIDLVNPWDDEA